MQFNTKLNNFIQNIFQQISKKFNYFKVYFGSGLFFLFSGFLIGNLFGSLLNIFNESIVWQGCVTIVIIIFVEIINYFMYDTTFLKKNSVNQEFFYFERKIIKPFYLINWNIIQNFFSQKIKYIRYLKNIQQLKPKKKFLNLVENFFLFYFFKFLYILKKILVKVKNFIFPNLVLFINNNKTRFGNIKFFIKSLNFLKIGILLGFFIDAFKVGS